MPFVSQSQRRKCYAMKAKGQAGSWDCDEWSEATPKGKKLPQHVQSAVVKLSKRAAAEPDDRKSALLFHQVAVLAHYG